MNIFSAQSLPEPTILRCLYEKLNPKRFPQMSGVMSAIVGYVLGVRFGNPAIAEIIILDGGVVLARPDGEVKSQMIGSLR